MEKVTAAIQNVGVNDREITLFEGQYRLENGMAYNSYVILDEKIAVLDTVDPRATKEWLANLEEALAGRCPDYLIVQHMESDHSGSIAALAERYPSMKIAGSAMALSMLKQFFPELFVNETVALKEGDTLSLGTHTLQFFAAPMVHWPEVMVTYEQTEGIVFSADGFGKFGTRDADGEWTREAGRYYFNICGKYGMQVQALLKKLSGLEKIAAICPLHGPVLIENLDFYVKQYGIWSSYEPEVSGVLIVCASIHGHTLEAAYKMKKLLEEKGESCVSVLDLCREDMHGAVAEAFRHDRLVLAAASYDGGIFPPMEDFLRRLQEKNYQKRTVALIENGSWAPVAGKAMKAMLEKMKEITLKEPVITIKSAVKPADIEKMEELAEILIQ